MIQKFVVNPLEECTYILHDDAREAIIVDCGALYDEEKENIIRYVDEHQLKVVAHLLTHSHFDHIFGADFVYQQYGVKPSMHKAELLTYEQAASQMRSFVGNAFQLIVPPVGQLFDDDDQVKCGNHILGVVPTPGHTQGGVCYYCESENILLSGDTLFYRSIGRTDLFGGDYATLIKSIKHRLFCLPPSTKVYPGHGPSTTIGEESR
ncbi:MAG: MBL fold metallo-hydrolase [Bacteroidaceae bacterium]|nr:MBL fold metallo-hydrolase [Bacteroidaceae bacterium]